MDATQMLLDRLDRFEDKLDDCVLKVEGVRGDVARVEQKVDLRHNALQDQVNDICERTDENAANLELHAAADATKFNAIDTQRQVTKARLGMLALLAGGAGVSIDKIWGRVVAFFSQ